MGRLYFLLQAGIQLVHSQSFFFNNCKGQTLFFVLRMFRQVELSEVTFLFFAIFRKGRTLGSYVRVPFVYDR